MTPIDTVQANVSLGWFDGMDWATPQFSKHEVDAAGDVLIKKSTQEAELNDAYVVINNWRSSHGYPLNTFQATLRYKSKQVYASSTVAQRIKRISSIRQKLGRLDWLKLADMQDIGGVRSIVQSVGQVDALASLYKRSDLKHKLDDEDDYIRNPKRSGYRGIHLIYRYHSSRTDTYNDLKIEMQFRSRLQHAWATAVETVGTFIQQALKASQGEQAWLRFFSLMGTALAFREHTPPVPETPRTRRELKSELREYARRLDVENYLRAYGAALEVLKESNLKDMHYFLVELDTKAKRIKIKGYMQTS